MVVDSSGKYVLITVDDGYGPGHIIVVNAQTLDIKTTIEVGRDSFGIAIDSYGQIWTGNIKWQPHGSRWRIDINRWMPIFFIDKSFRQLRSWQACEKSRLPRSGRGTEI